MAKKNTGRTQSNGETARKRIPNRTAAEGAFNPATPTGVTGIDQRSEAADASVALAPPAAASER
jgi:hypothetical protein